MKEPSDGVSNFSSIGWVSVDLVVVVWMVLVLGLTWQGFSTLRYHHVGWPMRLWLLLQSIPLMMLLSGFMVFSMAVCVPCLFWCLLTGRKPGPTLLADPLGNEP